MQWILGYPLRFSSHLEKYPLRQPSRMKMMLFQIFSCNILYICYVRWGQLEVMTNRLKWTLRSYMTLQNIRNCRYVLNCKQLFSYTDKLVHRAMCSLFQPDTDCTRVSKCGQLSQHWVKSSRLLGSTQVSVYTHPSPHQYSRQPIRVFLARQPANHKLTTILEIESGGGGHMTSTICTF